MAYSIIRSSNGVFTFPNGIEPTKTAPRSWIFTTAGFECNYEFARFRLYYNEQRADSPDEALRDEFLVARFRGNDKAGDLFRDYLLKF